MAGHGIDQRHHCHEQRDFAAGCNHDVCRRDFQISRVVKIISDRFSQRQDANNRAVAVFAFIHGPLECLIHRCGGVKIWLSEFEMNDGTAFALQFFGARIN